MKRSFAELVRESGRENGNPGDHIGITANLRFYCCALCRAGLGLVRVPVWQDRYQRMKPYAIAHDSPLCKLAAAGGIPIFFEIHEPEGTRFIKVFPGSGEHVAAIPSEGQGDIPQEIYEHRCRV